MRTWATKLRILLNILKHIANVLEKLVCRQQCQLNEIQARGPNAGASCPRVWHVVAENTKISVFYLWVELSVWFADSFSRFTEKGNWQLFSLCYTGCDTSHEKVYWSRGGRSLHLASFLTFLQLFLEFCSGLNPAWTACCHCVILYFWAAKTVLSHYVIFFIIIEMWIQTSHIP